MRYLIFCAIAAIASKLFYVVYLGLYGYPRTGKAALMSLGVKGCSGVVDCALFIISSMLAGIYFFVGSSIF